MPRRYPQDTIEKLKERESFQIFFSLIDVKTWEYIGSDHNDHGVDYSFEYIEEKQYKGYRILAQLKSSNQDLKINNNKICFDFPVKTANYAVTCAQPFIFFFVDLKNRMVYYLPIQDYFIANPSKMEKLEKNTESIRLFIPLENTIDNENLKEVAKAQYSFDEEKGLRKTRNS